MRARRPLCLLALLFVTLLLLPAPGHAQVSLESQVMAKINGIRSKRLIAHNGVHSVAWHHSADMASSGGLHHANADARISNAPPDPAEANGAPDDGYGRDWCENVTYVNYDSEAEAAGHIFEAWRRSGAHNRCMQDATMNVGAVGIYYDGNTWWATFIGMIDKTPPGAQDTVAPPARTSAPVARSKPAAKAAPPEAVATGQAPAPEVAGVTSSKPVNTAAVPSPAPIQTTPAPPREIKVIAGSVPEAGDARIDADTVLTPVGALRLGYPEFTAWGATLALGVLVSALRLKRRAPTPRKLKRIARKLGKDAPVPIRTPLPHSGRRERAAGARRQPELARG